MIKTLEPIDTEAVIKRMIELSGLKNARALAEAIGVNQQSITNIRARQSISLEMIREAQALIERNTGMRVSMDLLVYGDGEVKLGSGDSSEYVEVKKIGGGTLKLLKSLLTGHPANYMAHVRSGKLSIIDVTDKALGDGLVYIGTEVAGAIKHCKLLSNGQIEIEGESPRPAAELTDVQVLGRVVWQGQSV